MTARALCLGFGNDPEVSALERILLALIRMKIAGEIVSVEVIDGGKTGKALVVTLPDASTLVFAAGILSANGIAAGAGGLTADGPALLNSSTTLAKQFILGPPFNPPSIGANQNNYNGGDAVLWAERNRIRFTASGAFQFTGFQATQDSDNKLLINTSASTLSIMHENAGSTAGNRVLCPGNVTFSLTTNRCVWIQYDGTSQRWRVIG